MQLKRLSDNRAETERYLNRQEKLFYKLRNDIVNNSLNKGLSEKDFMSVYGEPIFCESSERDGINKKRCLYRHPTDYFSSDKIYITLEKQNIESWELIKIDK